jgi:hypothetical protein
MPVPTAKRQLRYLPKTFPTNDQATLLAMGIELATVFCTVNQLALPPIQEVQREEWHFDACAYYRPDTTNNRSSRSRRGLDDRKWTTPGINICVAKCQAPCPVNYCRLWSWPGSTTDRTPYGVIAHELGHHVDWTLSGQKGTYFGDYSIAMRAEARERPISSYCPNDAEWFAEMFRVYCTNAELLRQLRPKTYKLLRADLVPVSHGRDWRKAMGGNVPPRLIECAVNKGAM